MAGLRVLLLGATFVSFAAAAGRCNWACYVQNYPAVLDAWENHTVKEAVASATSRAGAGAAPFRFAKHHYEHLGKAAGWDCTCSNDAFSKAPPSSSCTIDPGSSHRHGCNGRPAAGRVLPRLHSCRAEAAMPGGLCGGGLFETLGEWLDVNTTLGSDDQLMYFDRDKHTYWQSMGRANCLTNSSYKFHSPDPELKIMRTSAPVAAFARRSGCRVCGIVVGMSTSHFIRNPCLTPSW